MGEVGCDGSVYINVTKNKFGLMGKVGLYFTEECFRFDEYLNLGINSESDEFEAD